MKIIEIQEDYIITGIKMQKVLVERKDGTREVITMPAIGEWK